MLEDKQQRTVNNNMRGLARKVKIALKSFKSVMLKEQAAKVPVHTNPRARELSGVRKELHFAPAGKPLLNPTEGTLKRRAGSPPSTETPRGNKRANQQKMQPARDQRDEREFEDSQAWKKVQKKKKEVKKTVEKIRRPRFLPNALLVSAKPEKSYADILKKVKKEMPGKDIEDNFEKMRRPASGQLLIVLNRKVSDKMGPLRKKMEEILKEEADIVCRTQDLDLQIKDIEKTTFKEELRAALQKMNNDDVVVKPESIRSLRVAYDETQTACVRLPVEIAHKAIGDRGKIRIGLVNCRIREVNRPLK
ncbi:hypothetical protein KM043_004799 [Ampulex compressa]|nr:hypothetical protein KM043_004799 [Ampulex compressa]